MSYLHVNFDWTRWMLGFAFQPEAGERALFIHLGPICIGIHRPDYYQS